MSHRKTVCPTEGDRALAKFCKTAEEREHTLHEIAEVMGVTRERVRQIEAKALKVLRHRVGILFKYEGISTNDIMSIIASGRKPDYVEHGLTLVE